MSEPRIRPGAGPLETKTIKKMHDIYARGDKNGPGDETVEAVRNRLSAEYMGVLREHDFYRGNTHEKTGSVDFISASSLMTLARDPQRVEKLVATLKSYEGAMHAADAYAVSQGQDYWTMRTYQHKMDELGSGRDESSRALMVAKTVHQERIEQGLEKGRGRERVTITSA